MSSAFRHITLTFALLFCAMTTSACPALQPRPMEDAAPEDDAGPEDDGDVRPDLPAPDKVIPDGVIVASAGYVTLKPGGSFDFTSKVSCPAKIAPCTYTWDFGDGQTSTKKDPGKITFAKAGWFKVKFTVTGANKQADPTPGLLRVAVWTGQFTDNFDRKDIEYEKYGWRPVLGDLQFPTYKRPPMYSINNGWLKTIAEGRAPGTEGLTAWPVVKNVHIEVLKKRETNTKIDHFWDVILRMHPSGGAGRFYRVRVYEMPDFGVESAIGLAIFKIFDPADEHGILLNDSSQPQHTLPIHCKDGCPAILTYPRTKNFKLIIDLVGATFDVRLEDMTGKLMVGSKATDTLGEPFLYAGHVGLTQFANVSEFDNFVVKELP